MKLIIKFIFLFNIEKIIIINSENYQLNGIYRTIFSINIKLFFLIIWIIIYKIIFLYILFIVLYNIKIEIIVILFNA